MRGGKAFAGIQEYGVKPEYRRALELGAFEQAERIFNANPDLHEELTM